MKLKVYPTSETSLVIAHPIDGALKAEGSDWELDGFTCRMLTDGALTSDLALAWSKEAATVAQAAQSIVASSIDAAKDKTK